MRGCLPRGPHTAALQDVFPRRDCCSRARQRRDSRDLDTHDRSRAASSGGLIEAPPHAARRARPAASTMHLLMPVAAAHGGGKHALAAACGAAATDSSATCWQAACCDHDEDVAPPTPTSAWQQQRPAPAQRAACRALSLPGAAGAPASSARRLLDSSGDYRAVCSWLDEQVSMRKAPRPRVLDIGALGQLDLAAAQGPPATPALQEEPRSCARGLPPPAFQLLGLL